MKIESHKRLPEGIQFAVFSILLFGNSAYSEQLSVFVADVSSSLVRFDLNGSSQEVVLTDVEVLAAVHDQAKKLYTRQGSTTYQSNLDGTERSIFMEGFGPRRMAFDSEDDRFFFSFGNNTYQSSISNPNPIETGFSLNNAADVEYHNGTDSLFIVNQTSLTSGDSIYRRDGPDYSNADRILTGFSWIGGCAVDDASDLVYFTIWDSGNTGVYSMEFDGSNVTRLIDTTTILGFSQPGDIEVSVDHDLIVWEDSNRIYTSDLDGKAVSMAADLSPFGGGTFDPITGQWGFFDIELAVIIPEPATLLLAVMASCGMLVRSRRLRTESSVNAL